MCGARRGHASHAEGEGTAAGDAGLRGRARCGGHESARPARAWGRAVARASRRGRVPRWGGGAGESPGEREQGRGAQASHQGSGGRGPRRCATGHVGGAHGRREGRGKGERERRERGGDLTSGSKSGDHRLQNLGYNGEEREGVVRGRIE
jgi:hypothetical protein